MFFVKRTIVVGFKIVFKKGDCNMNYLCMRMKSENSNTFTYIIVSASELICKVNKVTL